MARNPEVFVIGLKKLDLSAFRALFPQTVQFHAIDLRKSKPVDLAKAHLISPNAYDTLLQGRKWHKELSSTGAVGLQQSNRLALMSSAPERSLLLLEDDCVLGKSVLAEVDRLLEYADDFDVAVFGAILLHGTTTESPLLSNWYTLDAGAGFICTHCVLYTPRGKRKMVSLLNTPQEVQIDAYIGMLHSTGELDVLLNFDLALAHQRMHISSIQEVMGTCVLCDVSPTGIPASGLAFVVMNVLLLVLMIVVWRLVRVFKS